jgi:hypothetical protein
VIAAMITGIFFTTSSGTMLSSVATTMIVTGSLVRGESLSSAAEPGSCPSLAMPYIVRTIAASVAIEVDITAISAPIRKIFCPALPNASVRTPGMSSSPSFIAAPTSGSASSRQRSKTNRTRAVPAQPARIAWLGLMRECLVSSANAPAVSKPTICVRTSATTTRNGHR